jgi:hypothetical protein
VVSHQHCGISPPLWHLATAVAPLNIDYITL